MNRVLSCYNNCALLTGGTPSDLGLPGMSTIRHFRNLDSAVNSSDLGQVAVSLTCISLDVNG